LGLLLTKLAISVLIRLGPEQLPRLDMINIDWRILVFTLLPDDCCCNNSCRKRQFIVSLR
jgi:hypothetical protein